MDGVDPNNERDLENEQRDAELEFIRHLVSLGYDIERVTALAVAHRMLVSGTLKLTRRDQIPSTKNKLELSIGTGSDTPLEHDDALLPSWREFAKALASVPVRQKGNVVVQFHCLKLGQVVSDMLVESFTTLPLVTLPLIRCDLGISGFKFVTDILRNNFSLEQLGIYDDRISSARDATILMKEVRAHPNVDHLTLDDCGVGRDDIMAAVFPAAGNLRDVVLTNNAIGSYGAKVIADCLACNPVLEALLLSGNNLDDKDSEMIAASLNSNTNLRYLKVDGNPFAQYGVNALGGALLGNSLNESFMSNHTCEIHLGEAHGAIGTFLSTLNGFSDPMLNKKYKLMLTIGLPYKCAIRFHMIDNIPLEMMPKVLAFLQGDIVMDPSVYNRLDRLFQFIREWSMPLLYTSRIHPEKRRSNRIRENRIRQLMAKS